MNNLNPSLRPVHSRVYHLTRAGSRLAHYLEYVESRSTVSADIGFGDIPENPEDDDAIERASEEADRLIQIQDDERDDLISYDPEQHDDYGAHSPEED